MGHIVHLTSAHPPLDIRIFRKQCRSIAAAGHQVTIIAPATVSQSVQGVQIQAVPPSRGRWRRFTLTIFQVCWQALKAKGDVYQFHDPDLFPIGILLKMLGKRVVYDAHEDVSRCVSCRQWIPLPLRRLIAWLLCALESFVVRVVDAVVVATPSIGKRFPNHKRVLVQNYVIVDEFGERQQESTNRVAYVGVISAPRGAPQMIDAVDLLSDVCEVRLSLAGCFSPPDLRAELEEMSGWQYVDPRGTVSADEVQELLSRSQLGLVVFQPTTYHVEAQPNKLYEYMAAGLPVVASDFPLWRRIVEENQCGLVVDAEDPRAIADAMWWLIDHPDEAAEMGRRGKRAARTSFNWKLEAEKLLLLYDRLLPTHPANASC